MIERPSPPPGSRGRRSRSGARPRRRAALVALLAMGSLLAPAAPQAQTADGSPATAAPETLATGPWYYRGRPYGSESLVHPLRLILDGGFGILQFDNRDNHLGSVDFDRGWNRVWIDLRHPVRAIEVDGWSDFIQREVLPVSVSRKSAQYWPNYTLHVVGGGMSYAMMGEWYDQHGFGHPRWWAGGTMAVYHLLNEVVENDDRAGPTTDAISDLYLFDPAGILLFSHDGVNRFFSGTLHLRDWSTQPAIDPIAHTIENQGQNYAIKLALPRSEHWSLFYYFGNHGEAGLSYRRTDGRAYSFAAGLRAKALVDLGADARTAELVPSYGFFYDREGSLLFSVTSATSSRYSLRVNVYPGLLRVGGHTVGLFALWDRHDEDLVLGFHLPWAPLGGAGRP